MILRNNYIDKKYEIYTRDEDYYLEKVYTNITKDKVYLRVLDYYNYKKSEFSCILYYVENGVEKSETLNVNPKFSEDDDANDAVMICDPVRYFDSTTWVAYQWIIHPSGRESTKYMIESHGLYLDGLNHVQTGNTFNNNSYRSINNKLISKPSTFFKTISFETDKLKYGFVNNILKQRFVYHPETKYNSDYLINTGITMNYTTNYKQSIIISLTNVGEK